MQIQWCYFYCNWVRIDTAIPWILQINHIQPDLEIPKMATTSNTIHCHPPLWDRWGLFFHPWLSHLYEIYCTLEVGKSFPCYPFMWDILYLCGWKIIPSSSIYVIYIVPLQLENYTLIHLLMVRYVVPLEYEFQSHSSSNHQLFILWMAEPVSWIS